MAVKIEIKGARELARAINERAAISRRTLTEIINKAARNVTFRALQFSKDTPAGRSKIADEMKRNPRRIAYRMANKSFEKKRLERKMAAKRGDTRFVKKRGRGKKRAALTTITRAEIAKRARSIIRRYQATSGYTRASLINDAQTFGGAQRSKIKLYDDAGRKATERDTRAVITSGAPASTKVMGTPIEKALAFVAKDMTDYTNKTVFKKLLK